MPTDVVANNTKNAPSTKKHCLYAGTKEKVADYYTGPLIDTHLHIPSPIDSHKGNPVLRKDMIVADIACILRDEGTRAAFSFFPAFPKDGDIDQFYRDANNAKRTHPNLSKKICCNKKSGTNRRLRKRMVGPTWRNAWELLAKRACGCAARGHELDTCLGWQG